MSITTDFRRRSATVCGAGALIVGTSLGAVAAPAAASEVTEYGFAGGPECDAATSVAKVIAETETERYVLCQRRDSWPPDVHFIGENKFKPVPNRVDDVGFGPGNYVVNSYGNKILISEHHFEVHGPDGEVISSEVPTSHKFEL